MTKKNVAVIGAGYWGKNLVRNFDRLGVLKAVCDSDQTIRNQICVAYPGISVTEDVSAVLKDDEIQGVVIATPAALHYDLVDKTLRSGKHVFVEKPLSLNYDDGKTLVKRAAECGKILFVGHILQYHPAIARLKELVSKGDIGRLQYIYSRRLSLGKIRREENILWSFAPHDISVILSIVGEEPSYVDAVGSNFLHARIADVTVTNLKFPSGIGAHIFVSWLNPYKEQKFVIIGDRGMIVFDDTVPLTEKLVYYPHTIKWEGGLPAPQKAESIPIDLSDIWDEPLKLECQAFLKAIETKKEPITSGTEGLRVLKILELSQKSIEQKENLYTSNITTNKALPITHNYFVHDTAIVDDKCEVGKETKIWHFSHVLTGSRIGEKCNIGQNVVIGPDATIGNNCKIQNNVCVYKGVTLEDGVFCGPSMTFTNVYNPRAEISKMEQLRSTLVRKGATLGANCTIVCGHTIGRYAFIGAGTVVTKDVPDHALMVGNPAKQIGWMCICGERISDYLECNTCKRKYERNIEGRICLQE